MTGSQKCSQCSTEATVDFVWGPSSNARAALCQVHAQQWWDTYKHTEAGQRLSISPIDVPDEKITAKKQGEPECPTSQSAPSTPR